MTIILAQTNMRGGVGKTTTSVSVGHELAKRGKRVALIDCDSQRTLTIYLGVEVKVGHPTIYAFMTEPTEANVRGALIPYTGSPNFPVHYPGNGCLSIIAGARGITDASKTFDKTRERQPVKSFNAVLPYGIQTFMSDFDYILLDPSPATDDMTRAVTNAAHGVIAPLAAEPLSIEGINDLLGDLRDINIARGSLLNEISRSQARIQMPGEVQLLGLLAAKVLPQQMRVAQQLWADSDDAGIGHFNRTYIPCTDAGWAAPAEHVPIAVIAPQDPAAQAYVKIVDAIERFQIA
jgi:cellulose biosynthesis protein BcsQ